MSRPKPSRLMSHTQQWKRPESSLMVALGLRSSWKMHRTLMYSRYEVGTSPPTCS